MNPYLGFAALLMAGLDGVENKIHPGEAATKDLYHLPPEEDKLVPTVCHSLDQALEHLDKDRALPDQGRCVHRHHARRLHRTQDERSHALPHGGAPGRIRHVLFAVNPVAIGFKRAAQAAPFLWGNRGAFC
jgi:hypothetical protein